MDHFRQDLFPESERNLLKVSSYYYTLERARRRNGEVGLASVICNIPSRYLEERREEEAVDRIIATMRNHTGFNLHGPSESSPDERKFCVECTYVLKHSVTNAERTWTGSWRNTHGRLTDFVHLTTRAQLLAAVVRFSVPGAVEALLEEIFGDLDSEWEFNGLVSLVLNFSLRGVFAPQFRETAPRVTLLD